MNIIETKIPDINTKNIDQSKVNLAEKIINNINPLFNDLQQIKIDQFKDKMYEYKTIKKSVLSKKVSLESLFENYKKKQKSKQLLEKIDKLVSLGIISEGHSKQETIVLLKIIDKLDINKLNYHIKETATTISKRFPS